MWAVAEISWEDPTGTPYRAPATMEDTSVSGACLRVPAPIGIGSRLTVKWHREQFRAIARNCRSDGKEFLLGVRRDEAEVRNQPKKTSDASDTRPTGNLIEPGQHAARQETSPAKSAPQAALPEPVAAPLSRIPAPAQDLPSGIKAQARETSAPAEFAGRTTAPTEPVSGRASQPALGRTSDRSLQPSGPPSGRRSHSQSAGSSTRQERKVMESKRLFPNFWRRQQDQNEDASAKPTSTEAPVNNLNIHAADAGNGPRVDLLSYDDIYHAAGLMSPHSGYGIHKVVEMLNSERIRALSKDIQRASVLMALEAAGASADELLQDATRRQQALDSYEDGQRKQLEEFEARNMQENAQIQAEMERITAHYAERIQHNQSQVAKQKEALRNWQMAKQHESQRISEVIDLCSKQPANDARPTVGPSVPAASPVGATLQPSLVTKASAGY